MGDELKQLKDKKKEIDQKIKELRLKEMKDNTDSSSVNRLIRVSKKFDNEVVDTIEKIEKKLEPEKNKPTVSKPEITELIVKHKFWRGIKSEIIDFIFDKKSKNKRGQMTIFILVLIVALFFTSIMLLVAGITTIKINEALDQNITLGEVNLAEINAQTFGIAATTFLNNADWWGIAAIFGMILGLFLSSYLLRNRFSKLGIIFDIFILVITFIFAIYISKTYTILLDALVVAGEPFLEIYTPKTSMFIINLPIFTVIIGVIMMVLFHSSIPNKPEERSLYGGSLQGV